MSAAVYVAAAGNIGEYVDEEEVVVVRVVVQLLSLLLLWVATVTGSPRCRASAPDSSDEEDGEKFAKRAATVLRDTMVDGGPSPG